MKYAIITIAALLFAACESGKQKTVRTTEIQNKEVKKSLKTQTYPTTITIYRFGQFPENTARMLKKDLKVYFPNVALREQILPLPAKYYNKERSRYRGTGLFEELNKHRNSGAVIGLTDFVIFQPNDISTTFGIMGISPVGTYKCVVSSKLPRTC